MAQPLSHKRAAPSARQYRRVFCIIRAPVC